MKRASSNQELTSNLQWRVEEGIRAKVCYGSATAMRNGQRDCLRIGYL